VEKMEIINALEIKIVKKGDDEEDEFQNIEFTYQLIDYQADTMWLQFNFKDPQ